MKQYIIVAVVYNSLECARILKANIFCHGVAYIETIQGRTILISRNENNVQLTNIIKKMKVVSYNIDRNGPEPQRRYQRLAAQIYSYDPDIVFLHEVIEQYIGEFQCIGYGICLNSRIELCSKTLTVLYKLQYGSMISYSDCGTPSCTIASIHAKSSIEYEHIR